MVELVQVVPTDLSHVAVSMYTINVVKGTIITAALAAALYGFVNWIR